MNDNGVIELGRRRRGRGISERKHDGQRRKTDLWCLGLDLTRTSERTMNFSHFPRLVQRRRSRLIRRWIFVCVTSLVLSEVLWGVGVGVGVGRELSHNSCRTRHIFLVTDTVTSGAEKEKEELNVSGVACCVIRRSDSYR